MKNEISFTTTPYPDGAVRLTGYWRGIRCIVSCRSQEHANRVGQAIADAMADAIDALEIARDEA